jgi:hypothetical protein
MNAMSDDDWLQAMGKYDDSTGWGAAREDFLKGGVVELSRALTDVVKKDPVRFYNLAMGFDANISVRYSAAVLSGLGASDVSAERVFDLFRRLAPRVMGHLRREVCWAIQGRAPAGVPDDILDLVTGWASEDPDQPQGHASVLEGDDPGQRYQDPHDHGINTNRGAAIQFVFRCALACNPPQFGRAFDLLERFAADPSLAVRTCVIECCRFLLNQETERCLAIYDKVLGDYPEVVRSRAAQDFLYAAYRQSFPRLRGSIEWMLGDDHAPTRQAGARLTCLAAFFYPEAADLESNVMRGDAATRLGAAEVYRRNLGIEEVHDVCRRRLLILMYDSDAEVRKQVGQCFEHLSPDRLDSIRSFIDEFLSSPSLLAGMGGLVGLLKNLAHEEQELALRVTIRVLDAAGREIMNHTSSLGLLEDDIVRLPLIVYTHSTDLEVQSRSLELFEKILILGSQAAETALLDWDRR